MRPRTLLVMAALAALGACGPTPQKSPAAAVPAQGPVSDLPLKEFMGHVMQYSAENVWRWQQWVSDNHGEGFTTPKTEKEWLEAESAALALQELTYSLDQPGRRFDDPRWSGHVAAVRAAAKDAASAAEAHDVTKLMASGSQLNEACVSCHITYVPELEGAPPTKASSAARAK